MSVDTAEGVDTPTNLRWKIFFTATILIPSKFLILKLPAALGLGLLAVFYRNALALAIAPLLVLVGLIIYLSWVIGVGIAIHFLHAPEERWLLQRLRAMNDFLHPLRLTRRIWNRITNR